MKAAQSNKVKRSRWGENLKEKSNKKYRHTKKDNLLLQSKHWQLIFDLDNHSIDFKQLSTSPSLIACVRVSLSLPVCVCVCVRV